MTTIDQRITDLEEDIAELLTACQSLIDTIETKIDDVIDPHIADGNIHFTEASIDHTSILNVGSNTHAQIDTHIGSTSNPHAVSLEQARIQNNQVLGDIDLNSNKIINLPTPTVGTDATNKDYVDNLVEGLKWKESVLVATTVNISLTGEQTIDGILTSGSRVLVKDQTAGSENGLYITSTGSWTRSSDADSGNELVSAAVNVEQGTTNADVMFVCTNDSISIGVTPISFVTLGSTISHNNTTGLDGGTSGQYFHLTNADHSALTDPNAQLTALYTDGTPTFAATTINGDLAVDTNTLFVDSASNEVGIRTTSPTEMLSLGNSTDGARFFLAGKSGVSNDYVISTDNGNLLSLGRTTDETMLVLDFAGKVGVGEPSPDYDLDINGSLGFSPGSSVTPVDNGDVVIEFTNNTTLTFKAKGTDGTVRSATLTLT